MCERVVTGPDIPAQVSMEMVHLMMMMEIEMVQSNDDDGNDD